MKFPIFHHPSSPPSVKALGLLRSALSEPFPPGKGPLPLSFNLEVVEAPPTKDQLEHANLQNIVDLGREKPNTFKWPIVVDWNAGKACIGDADGVKGILEHLRQQRDGEVPKE
ncbi:DUF1687-domain-containing protein [Mycena sanguinolenta]|uniref:DUF1687-domain-containing protein n=1 Tax=Mycena sanguinolenta TaxID=230812 RepID=A0A8H6YZ73_9AGAR|nr:DUF1687-domain-containing protein [Mycena sanguinolenta]